MSEIGVPFNHGMSVVGESEGALLVDEQRHFDSIYGPKYRIRPDFYLIDGPFKMDTQVKAEALRSGRNRRNRKVRLCYSLENYSTVS